MFERIGSATEAQKAADGLKSTWHAETTLILRVLIYCAFRLEDVIRKLDSLEGNGPYGKSNRS